MKVIVCGSRDWSDDKVIEREFKKLPPGTVILHGAGTSGVDFIADKLAMKYGFQIRRYPINEESHGKSAASMRNSKMIRNEHISGSPISLGLVFTSDLNRSRDVKDCVERARKAGIKMNVISE